MSDAENILWWASILMFVVGAFLLFLRTRRWYQSRTWDDVMHTVDSIEETSATRFSLRRLK